MKKYADELENPGTAALNYLENEKDLLISIRTFQNVYIPKAPFNVDYEKMKSVAANLKEAYKIENFDERFLREVHRSQGRSDINIYSIAGALAGQEAIKLITECFTPMNGGYLFNGALGKGYQVKL